MQQRLQSQANATQGLLLSVQVGTEAPSVLCCCEHCLFLGEA